MQFKKALKVVEILGVTSVFVIAVIALLCMVLVGVLMIFGSFFFEQTWAQMTWWIFFEHVLLFLGGVVLVSVPLTVFVKVVTS